MIITVVIILIMKIAMIRYFYDFISKSSCKKDRLSFLEIAGKSWIVCEAELERNVLAR